MLNLTIIGLPFLLIQDFPQHVELVGHVPEQIGFIHTLPLVLFGYFPSSQQ